MAGVDAAEVLEAAEGVLDAVTAAITDLNEDRELPPSPASGRSVDRGQLGKIRRRHLPTSCCL